MRKEIEESLLKRIVRNYRKGRKLMTNTADIKSQIIKKKSYF